MVTEIKFIITAIVFLPFLASLIVLLTGKFTEKYIPSFVLPILCILISFFFSLYLLSKVYHGEIFEFDLFTWIPLNGVKIGIGFLIDALSILMVCMVLSLSLLIHIYSIGYMAGDPGFYRFFAYISLFTFSMLLLVTSNNLVQLYFGWEAVGLCSYLLIGFWYEKKSASDAAKKAFIMNRIGDFGFALGIFVLFSALGTLYYNEIFSKLDLIQDRTIELLGIQWHLPFLICFLLFLGAMGKSAQFPLHTWLPDAMEGPTPVSALIHAATMVTAGVFMIARMYPLYLMSPEALALIAIIGAFTCFMAATIAITQFDIKRIIAYSTLSQLGYMFMACGVGAYWAGIFHLFTHAYFKALLFLSAGSVIHVLHHNNDIRIMGGLRKYMPYTFINFLIGALALSSVPGFSGFFSKEAILLNAYYSHYPWGKLIWLIGMIVAVLTSFYIFRLIFLVFFGEFRGRKYFPEPEKSLKEAPLVMIIPLFFIAIGAIFAGYLDVLGFLKGAHIEEMSHYPHHYALMILGIVASLSGIILAWFVYLKKPSWKEFVPQKLPWLYTFIYKKWYFDELYSKIFIKPTLVISQKIVNFLFDSIIIEGIVNGSAKVTNEIAKMLRSLHAGLVNHYGVFVLIGACIFLLSFLLIIK